MSSTAHIPEQLWARAAGASCRLLMLDYDGTLAPFRVDRLEAVPSRRVVDLLERISAGGGTRLAVISGRPVEELDRLLGGLRLRLAGEHGWETRLADHRILRHPVPAASLEALRLAAAAAAPFTWGAKVERKRASLMLHWRGLSPEEAARIEDEAVRLWEGEARRAGLRLCRVSGGIELRAVGRHKGEAVRDLLAESPPGTLPVYVGDDATDEDAFAAVLEAGFGLLVSERPRPSRAAGRVASVEGVTAFLETWLARVEGARPAAAPPVRVGS